MAKASARHILVKTKEQCEELKTQIEAGTDFAEVAKVHSTCPSKRDGGALGEFSPGMMVPEFDNAVFSMEVGTLSEIIETQFGYHIIYKTGADEGGEASFPEASAKIRDFMRHARRGELVSGHVTELREKADIQGL